MKKHSPSSELPGFASKAQVAKFQELHKQGKISIETIASRALHTPDVKNLPDRINPKKK